LYALVRLNIVVYLKFANNGLISANKGIDFAGIFVLQKIKIYVNNE